VSTLTVPAPLVVQIARTPPRILSSNNGSHRRTKEPYVAEMRKEGATAAQNVLVGQTWAWAGPIRLLIHIAWDHGKRLDYQNAVTLTKSVVDGVFDKLDADDRQVEIIHLTQSAGNKTPSMIIQVEAMERRSA